MKKILTILAIAFIAGLSSASAQQIVKATVPEKSVMVYSEEDEALVYKHNSKHNGKEILIESLPVYGFEDIPVEISMMENGSYTFKKGPSLVLPEYYSVVIVDSLTGKQFDLKDSDSYTFEVAKETPDRFLLKMSKSKTKATSMF